MPIRHERSTEAIFYSASAAPLSLEAKLAANKLFSISEALLSRGSENLFGEWCIADVDLALMLNRLVMNGDPVPSTLVAYVKRQWQRPSVRRWADLSRPPC
jgi:glutathione S-transferase